MACFLVPAAEAIVATVAVKVLEKKEEAPVRSGLGLAQEHDLSQKTPFSRKLKWLRNLLWGGCLLLAFEHLWHGEIVPWFPFLTAASDPAETASMLHEMATVGVAMAVSVTAVWLVMLAVSTLIEKRAQKAGPEETERSAAV
ncbi:MAG: hypothetical protein K6C36_10455 [Clostridia bacterium]|nr:hypothetical protein [Clostridia bacterium]